MAILAAWGVVYIWQCLLALSSGGVPITYAHETPGGTLSLRAESYHFDVPSNVLRLDKISIKEPNGRLLASARSLLLTDVIPGRRPIHANARQIYVRVERKPNGKLRLLDYLPTEPPKESDQAYTGDFKQVSILFEDRTTKQLWTRWGSSQLIRLDGVGAEWRTSAQIKIQSSGSLYVSARSSRATGVLAKFSTGGLEVAELVRRLANSPDGKDIPELRDVSASSARFAGDGYLDMPPEGPPVWSANFAGQVRDFAFAMDVRARDVTVSGAAGAEGVTLRLSALDKGASADFDGVVRWEGGVSLAGTLDTKVAAKSDLPAFLKRKVPKDVEFKHGELTGWVSYRSKEGVRVVGDASMPEGRWADQSARNISAKVDLDDRHLVVTGAKANWEGTGVSGALQYVYEGGALDGHFQAPNASLTSALKRYGLTTIAGHGDIQILLDGTSSEPRAIVRAEGTGRSLLQDKPVDLGRFEIGGIYHRDRFNINRFTLLGPSGAATANGSWDTKSQKVDLDVLATGVSLQAFLDEVAGSAAFSGKVTGSPKSLRAAGQIEVFNASAAGQDLPFARGDVVIDKEGLKASQVLAFKKGAQANGEGSVRFKDKALSGIFTVLGIDLSGYPPTGVTGMAHLSNGVLSGTLEDPILEAELEAENVAARGVALDLVDLHAVVRKGVVRVDRIKGTAGDGTIRGSGILDIQAESGSFDLTGDSLPLGLVLAKLFQDVSVEGLLNGTVRGDFAGGKFANIAFDGELQSFKVNDAFLGGGPVTASGNATNWMGTLFLGNLDAYIQIPSLIYDSETGKIQADVVSDNFQAKILHDSLKRYLTDATGRSRVSDDVRQYLESFDGKLDVDARVTGDLGSPDVDVHALKLDAMTVAGQAAGQLLAKGTRKDQVWNLDQVEWTGGPGLVKVNRGRIDEHGAIDLDGEVRNLRWKWLAPFFPATAHLEGRSDLPFLVTGQTNSPEIQASFSYEEGIAQQTLTPWPGVSLTVRNPRQTTRRIDLESVSVKEGSIDAQGVFNIEGFTGTIEGKIPFRYPLEIPESEPWTALARMPDRPINSLSEFIRGLDTKKTEGSVSAQLALSGNRANPLVTGSVQGNAKTLAFEDLVTRFNDLTFLAQFENEKVSLSASGKGSGGGSFETEDVGFTLANLDDAFRESLNVLLANQLYGTFRLNDLKLDYVDEQGRPMTATVSGALGLAGTLEKPTIGGELLLSNANITTPPAYEAAAEAPKLLVDPRFDIAFLTANNMLLRVPTGRFELSGGGRLQGTLSSPVFVSTLEVESGNVRLPNARIVIEPGGTVSITYRSSPTGTSVARVEVDMQGRTQVSAESFTGIVERYDITLNIRGDLLTDNGLILTAQADPPDLSQDRILAILGQRDVLVGRSGESFRADRQLQSALLGLAVPYFAGSFTEDLARQLGLDYLNIEYNTFDRFAVTAAISLRRDLVLSGRRQLSSPLPGERPKYDIRLSYRPPFRNKALRRFTFSIGMDQDRPWKIAVEYGIRF